MNVDDLPSWVFFPAKERAEWVNSILKCPDRAGVFRVKLKRASDLMNKDGFASGKRDPYIIMTVGAHTHRVPTIMDTLNPHRVLTYDFHIEVVRNFVMRMTARMMNS